MERKYKAVFFDLGGTLRIAYHEKEWERQGRENMAKVAGVDMPYEEFYKLIDERYKAYRDWALRENKESNDWELWHKWLMFDYDEELVRSICHRMSYEYRQSTGHRYVVDGGVEVIKGLYERGYKLGIISNLIGETEVPDWLEADGLKKYFSSVILSSVVGLRKPGAEIYRVACRDIGVAPEYCVSGADNVGRDIEGANEAGIGMNIVFDSPEKKHPIDVTNPEALNIGAIVKDFRDILKYLP